VNNAVCILFTSNKGMTLTRMRHRYSAVFTNFHLFSDMTFWLDANFSYALIGRYCFIIWSEKLIGLGSLLLNHCVRLVVLWVKSSFAQFVPFVHAESNSTAFLIQHMT